MKNLLGSEHTRNIEDSLLVQAKRARIGNRPSEATMNAKCRKTCGWVALIGLVVLISAPVGASLIQPVSLVGSDQESPSGGNGDSSLPPRSLAMVVSFFS